MGGIGGNGRKIGTRTLEGCQFGDEPVNQGIPTLVRDEFEQLGDIDAVNDGRDKRVGVN